MPKAHGIEKEHTSRTNQIFNPKPQRELNVKSQPHIPTPKASHLLFIGRSRGTAFIGPRRPPVLFGLVLLAFRIQGSILPVLYDTQCLESGVMYWFQKQVKVTVDG